MTAEPEKSRWPTSGPGVESLQNDSSQNSVAEVMDKIQNESKVRDDIDGIDFYRAQIGKRIH